MGVRSAYLRGSRVRYFVVIDSGEYSRAFYMKGGKRILDLLISIPLLVLLFPIIAILLLVTASDGHNPLFAHKRVGKNGRLFPCLKVRTMVVDASERLAELLKNDPDAAAQWAKDRKLDKDPRITRIGGFLRKTSLDELPQLWNVIRGDMSLVGPRPVIREELELYGKWAVRYESLKPGLTGPWQVSGRNEVSYDERVMMDVRYARRHTLPGDLGILLLTSLAVLNRTGK
jgi:exopolysaccharide production protein ExoY